MSKESRAEYYMKAFEKLEHEGKHTWNWAAFFFPGSWMIYRKMYLYSFLLLLARLGIVVIGFGLVYLFHESISKDAVLCGILFVPIAIIAVNVLCGYYGNELYRRAVAKKISKGYHKLEHFCPTSLTCALLEGFLVMFLIMFADWMQKEREKIDENKLEAQEKMPTKENVEMYLNPRKKKSGIMYAAICMSILCLLSQIVINVLVAPSFEHMFEQVKTLKSQGKIDNASGQVDSNGFQNM